MEVGQCHGTHDSHAQRLISAAPAPPRSPTSRAARAHATRAPLFAILRSDPAPTPSAAIAILRSDPAPFREPQAPGEVQGRADSPPARQDALSRRALRVHLPVQAAAGHSSPQAPDPMYFLPDELSRGEDAVSRPPHQVPGLSEAAT